MREMRDSSRFTGPTQKRDLQTGSERSLTRFEYMRCRPALGACRAASSTAARRSNRLRERQTERRQVVLHTQTSPASSPHLPVSGS